MVPNSLMQGSFPNAHVCAEPTGPAWVFPGSPAGNGVSAFKGSRVQILSEDSVGSHMSEAIGVLCTLSPKP